MEEKALLILDNATAHRPEEELMSDDQRVVVLFLPPNCTALIQPMDQNLIQNIKINYRKWLLQEILAKHNENIAICLKNISLKDAVFALAESWTRVPLKLIKKSWSQLLTINENCGEWDDENLISIDDLREINELTELINKLNRSDVPIMNSEVECWARGNEEIPLDCEILSDEDIIAKISGQIHSGDDEDENSVTKVSTKDAINSFNLCLQWAEENELDLQEILLLRKIRSKAIEIKTKKGRQTTLDDFVRKDK